MGVMSSADVIPSTVLTFSYICVMCVMNVIILYIFRHCWKEFLFL